MCLIQGNQEASKRCSDSFSNFPPFFYAIFLLYIFCSFIQQVSVFFSFFFVDTPYIYFISFFTETLASLQIFLHIIMFNLLNFSFSFFSDHYCPDFMPYKVSHYHCGLSSIIFFHTTWHSSSIILFFSFKMCSIIELVFLLQ